MTFVSLPLDSETPGKVATFVREVVEPYLRDVHAMLRLPLPDQGIEAGCNYGAAGTLLAVIAGASVRLFEPGQKGSGYLFRETVCTFYPWHTEPPEEGVTRPEEGAKYLWHYFRNPLAHAVGHYVDPPEPRQISRLWKRGLSEEEIEAIEHSRQRPVGVLTGAPTLRRNSHMGLMVTMDLNVEALYWGVREMLCRLTTDRDRMVLAEQSLMASEG